MGSASSHQSTHHHSTQNNHHNTKSSSQINGKFCNNSTMTNGKQQQQIFSQETPKLKGILKNKELVKNETIIHEPVKVVELYVQRGNEWTRTRVREDEAKARKKELKSDKTVKRVYQKPTCDTTYLYSKAI